MKRFLFVLLGLSHGLVLAQSYTLTEFDVPGAAHTYAVAINNSGQILGWFLDAGGSNHCFLRSPDGASFTTFDPPGTLASCNGLNNLGQVVGSFSDSKGYHAFLRSPAGQLEFFDIPMRGPGANAAAINDRGEIVGTLAQPPYGGPGYVRSPTGEFTDLTASIGQIAPAAINNRGEIAGWALFGSSYGTQHGFLRSADGVVRQFDLPGTVSYTRILALNNNGVFAGLMVGGLGFVGNPDGAFTLLPGYEIFGIDDAGRIVGRRFVSGTYHAFIGTPGPASTAPEIRTALPGVLPASAFGGGYRDASIAPGTWIEIYGRNLSPAMRQWTSADFRDGLAPTSLDGVRVTIAGVPAFVSYISPGQVNALVPASVPAGKAQVILTNGARDTAPYPVDVVPSRPGILAMPPLWSPDTAYVAALFPDFTTYALPPLGPYTALPRRRPKAGDTLILFGMGFGPVSTASPLAGRFEISFSRADPPVYGKVAYAGLAPGTLGLYQFNVVLPDIPLFPNSPSDDFVNVNIFLDGNPVATQPSLRISIEK